MDLRLVEKVVCALPQPPQLVCLNPHTLEDVLLDMAKVGHAVGHIEQAESAMQALRQRIRHASDVAASALADRNHVPIKVCPLLTLFPKKGLLK